MPLISKLLISLPRHWVKSSLRGIDLNWVWLKELEHAYLTPNDWLVKGFRPNKIDSVDAFNFCAIIGICVEYNMLTLIEV